jgi:flagellar biosynthesis protein FliP
VATILRVVRGAALLIAASEVLAAAPAGGNTLFGISGAGAGMSVPMRITLGLTLLAFLPAVIMALTPFLRIITVLHFLRQALGTQTVPSNQILVGLTLLLTMMVMQPVIKDVYTNAWLPMEAGKLSTEKAFERAGQPARQFLLRFAREKDIQLFLEISHTPTPAKPTDLDFVILAPAYILSELKAGFQIGAILYLPFLLIDIIVASITLSIGMMQLPPVMISAPFKILLFVLVDGWNLVIGSLVRTFYAS